MSRIDAQKVVEIIFNVESRQTPILFIVNKYSVSPKKYPLFKFLLLLLSTGFSATGN
jgi:hypothetical protein